MDESAYEYEHAHLAEAARRFPAHRLAHAAPRPDSDVSYLVASSGVEFASHAWDEAGHL